VYRTIKHLEVTSQLRDRSVMTIYDIKHHRSVLIILGHD